MNEAFSSYKEQPKDKNYEILVNCWKSTAINLTAEAKELGIMIWQTYGTKLKGWKLINKINGGKKYNKGILKGDNKKVEWFVIRISVKYSARTS